jgi:hypothetical protein
VASWFDLLSPDGDRVFVTDLPNPDNDVKGTTRERFVADANELAEFIRNHDGQGRSLYYCVSLLKSTADTRSKANIDCTWWAWAECDFKDYELEPKEILRRILYCPKPPSIIVHSGHGLHCLWRLLEPEDASVGEGQQRIENLLRLIAAYTNGDPSACETSRLLRIPGSTNSKNNNSIGVKYVVVK